jgi:hypothetical protein
MMMTTTTMVVILVYQEALVVDVEGGEWTWGCVHGSIRMDHPVVLLSQAGVPISLAVVVVEVDLDVVVLGVVGVGEEEDFHHRGDLVRLIMIT